MNQKLIVKFLFACSVCSMFFPASDARSQVVIYDNGTNSTYNGNFNYNNASAGNEIILAGPATSDYISQFTVQFDLVNNGGMSPAPTGNEAVDLSFYQNNGAAVDGYASPGTLLYDSGFYTMSSIGLASFTLGMNLTYTPDVVVPQDFTWVLTFENVPATEAAGLALRSPPTVGNNYEDAWYNTGSGWQLDVADPAMPGNPPLEFGALAFTPVPEPSALWLVNFAAAGGYFWIKRRKNR